MAEINEIRVVLECLSKCMNRCKWNFRVDAYVQGKTEDIEYRSARGVWMGFANRSSRTVQESLGVDLLRTEGFIFQVLDRWLAQESKPKTGDK
jgi:hypothetical protein